MLEDRKMLEDLEEHMVEMKERKCLRCNKRFTPASRGNYICAKCHHDDTKFGKDYRVHGRITASTSGNHFRIG